MTPCKYIWRHFYSWQIYLEVQLPLSVVPCLDDLRSDLFDHFFVRSEVDEFEDLPKEAKNNKVVIFNFFIMLTYLFIF